MGKVEQLYKSTKDVVKKDTCAFLALTLDGIEGDRHAGAMKKADSRDKGIVRGTMIRNWRQWSAVSAEELNAIAANLNIGDLEGALLGPNLVISGIGNFTQLPPGTLLKFPDAVLLIEAENDPCTKAGKTVATAHAEISPHSFVKAACHLRGLVGTVQTAGMIKVGDSVEVVRPQSQL
jgi:hypothetical protein